MWFAAFGALAPPVPPNASAASSAGFGGAEPPSDRFVTSAFSGRLPLALLHSVFEFLERTGVRRHGNWGQCAKSVNLMETGVIAPR